MSIAELHGKLRSDNPGGVTERLEDLLTSDVFGTMKYAGWDTGFMDWLRLAVKPDGSVTAGEQLPPDSKIHAVHILFWPLLKNGREPDLLLGIETKNQNIVAVMVEAKYLSGPSDMDASEEHLQFELSGNQIADQVNGFPRRFPGRTELTITARLHVYITAHYSCPSEVYRNAQPHIRNKRVVTYWLNWQRLKGCLHLKATEDAGKRAMIHDLARLLERKDLVPFSGFRTLPPSFVSLRRLPGGFWNVAGKGLWNIQPPQLPSSSRFWRTL